MSEAPALPGLPDSLKERLRSAHIGVDEVGRGCLAGPVTAGAVLALPSFDLGIEFPDLDDSKALPENIRLDIERLLRESPVYWTLGYAWPEEIDEVNILNATFRAMSRAVFSLYRLVARRRLKVDMSQVPLFVDGSQSIPEPQWRLSSPARALAGELPALPRQFTVVKGDSLVPAISAASIFAKVQRDKFMTAMDKRYPGYNFANHKGYGTKEHQKSIDALGLCPLHRKTFKSKPEKPEQFSLL